MRRSASKLSSAVWPISHRSNSSAPLIRWSSSTIPPRAGESSKRSFQSTPGLASNSSSRQPDHIQNRDLHSTARSSGQPRRSDDHDDYDYGDIPADWGGAPPQKLSRSTRGTAKLDPEWEGVDISLSTSLPNEDESYPFDYDELPTAPSFIDHLDPNIKTAKKKRRSRKDVPEKPPLPPLPEGQLPPDGMSRFDWRETSLSSGLGMGKKKGGDLWYPHLARIKREEAMKGKLEIGETFHDERVRYEEHFKPLLEAEYREEERILLQRLQERTMTYLENEGVMLHELGAKVMPKQPKNVEGQVWTFHYMGKKDNTDLPYNKLDAGSDIFLSRTDPCYDPVLFNGTVRLNQETSDMPEGASGSTSDSEEKTIDPSGWLKAKVYSKSKKFIRVIMPVKVENLDKGVWRLDLGMSDWSLKMQLQAISALHNDSAQQDMQDFQGLAPAQSTAPKASSNDSEDAEIESILADMDRARNKQIQTILNGTSTRDLLLRAFQTDYQIPETSANLAIAPLHEATTMKPSDIHATSIPTPHAQASARGILARDQLIQSWARRYRGPKALRIEGDPEINLNPSQLRAMAMMLSERISLVQGPPGTGKTRVIVEVIKLLKHHFKVPFPIMVCAHTNVAVDNLLAPLRKEGIKAIRTGSTARVRDDLKQYTMESMEEEHPLFPRLEALREKMKKLVEEIGTKDQTTSVGQQFAQRKERFEEKTALSRRIYGLQRIIDREILISGDVICTTLLSAASRKMQQIDFPMVFIDEASMATEPLTIIPLMKGSSHVAIIGDHKQLPPVIISPEAHAGGLSTSLFERLIHEKHIPSVMLDTQYRMHSDISSFPNRAFYAGALQDGPPLDGTNFDPPRTSFLCENSNTTFIDHDHPESSQSYSLANYGDASIVCDLIADLLYHNPDLKGSQIGIIAPYTAQVRLILDRMLDEADRKAAFEDVLGHERTKELQDIEVKTVDGFQGREKEIMIVSMVRSNPGGWVGFLGDWRRLNVALTRARRALFMIGSARTLANAKYGKAASEHLPQGGAEILRDHIRHLRQKGLIMPVE